MKEILYKPIHSGGSHLAPSRNTIGTVRGATLDNVSNQLDGQAEFLPIFLDEAPGAAKVVAGVVVGVSVGVVGVVALIKHVPRLRRWMLGGDAQTSTPDAGDETDEIASGATVLEFPRLAEVDGANLPEDRQSA